MSRSCYSDCNLGVVLIEEVTIQQTGLAYSLVANQYNSRGDHFILL